MSGPPFGARPAFNINLKSVLFISAAAGGKAAEGISEIKATATNEWKFTLLDTAADSPRKDFSITKSSLTAKAGGTIQLTYSGAAVGENEYISVILEDENGVQYYGRVLKPENNSGTVSMVVPADLAEGSYTLNMFSEQYNGDRQTDYASAFDSVTLNIDNTAPALSENHAERGSISQATAGFTSSEAGTYYYAVVESGASAPEMDTAGAGSACIAGENTIFLTALTDAKAKDVCIVVKDAAGNVSEKLIIGIPAVEFTITFDTDGGSEAAPITQDYVTAVTAPDKSEKEGYTFLGWEPALPETMPLDSLTVKAKWVENSTLSVKAVINEEFSDADIPQDLASAGIDTVEKIVGLLKTEVSKQQSNAEDMELYDVQLVYSADGGRTWIKAGEEHFPANGKLTVMLPVPKESDPLTHIYHVVHMFISSAFGKQPGKKETPEVTVVYDEKNVSYLRFDVTGLSPIMVSWAQKPVDVNLPQTGDSSHMALWMALLTMAGTGVLMLRRKAHN